MKKTRIKTSDVAPTGGTTFNPEFWRNIFDAVDDPVFLHDPHFRILLANLAYCREAGMDELMVLQKELLVHINVLVQENRHWAGKPWSHGDNTFVVHEHPS